MIETIKEFYTANSTMIMIAIAISAAIIGFLLYKRMNGNSSNATQFDNLSGMSCDMETGVCHPQNSQQEQQMMQQQMMQQQMQQQMMQEQMQQQQQEPQGQQQMTPEQEQQMMQQQMMQQQMMQQQMMQQQQSEDNQ